MKSITIQGKKRESVGKVNSKALRNAEQVPCVVYGASNPIHFSTEEKSFKNLVYTPEAHTVVISLESGETINAILQDVQFHPVTDKILHADFYAYQEDKPISLEIPVRLEGRSIGVMRGGVLRLNMRKLRVKALPANLPDEILIDISPLKIGHKKYVADLNNEKYTFMHPENAVVVAIRTSRVAVQDDDDDDEEVTEGAQESSENQE